MNRVSDNYADGLEIRIKELIAERDALAAKLAGIEVQLTQAFVHTAKLALQEPVAYEIEATRFANGKQLTYDKPSNLPGYITYRPLYAALSAAPAPQAQECTRSHPHELMDGCCELRTELARLTNENAILKAAPQSAQGEWINDEGRLKWAMCRIAELESALQSAQPVAPEGYKLVPIKPSAQQLKAARESFVAKHGPAMKGTTWASPGYDDLTKMYEAMLDAVSAQPVAQPLTIEAIKSMDCRITLDEHIRVVRMTESALGIGALQDHIPDAGKMGKPMRELTDEEVKAAAIEIAFIVWPDTGYVGWTDDDKVFFREFTRTVLKKARG